MYWKDRYTITCIRCGQQKQTGDNRIKYCSIACYNTHTKTKGIDGYKPCEWCQKDMPYRNSLKVRACGDIKSVNSRFCSHSCAAFWKDKYIFQVQREEINKKLRVKAKLRPVAHLHTAAALEKRRNAIMGNNHWNWQGGKTSENKKRRNSYETRCWRKAVFERDNYTCVLCGIRGNYLEADHIVPWSVSVDLRYDINNGRTLCRDCHRSTPTYGVKANLLQ